ncbi:MAG TPA: cytochrome c biogenesis protein CcdA [Microlunatus sp.]
MRTPTWRTSGRHTARLPRLRHRHGAADLVAGHTRPRRTLAGAALFVLGFASVFVAAGVIFGTVGQALVTYQTQISRAVGVVTIAMGLVFTGLLPIGRREMRLQRMPAVGLAGAPLLGIVFGLGWTPCIGPTLSVVLSLALTEASASRGGLLAFTYALGIPFLIAAVAFAKMTRAVDLLRRHQQTLLRLGGGAMIAVGILLVTGLWDRATAALRLWAAQFTTIL